MKLYDEEGNAMFEEDSTASFYKDNQESGLQGWEVVVFALVGVVCFVLVTAALIFAVHQQLCGHCVIWVDSASEMTKACTTALKRRYEHLNPDENGRTMEFRNTASGQRLELSNQNSSIV